MSTPSVPLNETSDAIPTEEIQTSNEIRENLDGIRVFNNDTPRNFLDGTMKVSI